MSAELAGLLRSVLDAAQAWRRGMVAIADECEPEAYALASALDVLSEALDATPNEPTGFVLKRAWSEVPAGWFVRHPKNPGEWLEVVSTRREDDKQWVSLRVGDQVGEWPRDPQAEVSVRKGTRTEEMDRALSVLTDAFGAVQVMTDGGQFS